MAITFKQYSNKFCHITLIKSNGKYINIFCTVYYVLFKITYIAHCTLYEIICTAYYILYEIMYYLQAIDGCSFQLVLIQTNGNTKPITNMSTSGNELKRYIRKQSYFNFTLLDLTKVKVWL